MNKKKILFVEDKERLRSAKRRIHYNWVTDKCCIDKYDIKMFGPGYYDNLSLKEIKKVIDKFKPDYIYCYNRSKIHKWLPNLSSIKNVPKIMVELDTYKYSPTDEWYSQFDKLYHRSNWGTKYSVFLKNSNIFRDNIKFQKPLIPGDKLRILGEIAYKNYKRRIANPGKWQNIKLFRWSIKRDDIFIGSSSRSGIRFIGKIIEKLYCTRKLLSNLLKDKIQFSKNWGPEYNNILRSSSVLLCPTESNYGDFIPAKLFEFSASGAAILTNCDLIGYNMKDLDEVVIKYTSLDDLKDKLDIDFTKYYNKASEVMKNHTHDIRYDEIFV